MKTNLPIRGSLVRWCEMPRRRELAFDVSALVVAGICESAATGSWLHRSVDTGTLVLVHGAVIGYFAVALILRTAERRESLFASLDLVSVASFGPLGCFGALVVRLCLLAKPIGRDGLRALMPPEPENGASEAELLVARIRNDQTVGQTPTVAAFEEIMRWGTIEEKQRALSQIVRNFSPDMLPTIRRALGDSANLVRVQAASTITTLEERAHRKLFELRERVRSPWVESGDPRFELARHLEWMESSGIIDEMSGREHLDEAILQYRRCDMDDPAVLTALGRALVRAGRVRDAVPHLERAIELSSADARVRQVHHEAVFLLLQAFSKAGDFGACRKLAARVREEIGAVPGEFGRVLFHWASGGAQGEEYAALV